MKSIKLFGLAMIAMLCIQVSNAGAAAKIITRAAQQVPAPPPPPPRPHKLTRPPFHKHRKWRRQHKNLHLPPLPPPPPAPPAHP